MKDHSPIKGETQSRPRCDPAAEEVGDDAEEFVKEEQERYRNFVVPQLIEVEHNKHAKGPIRDGKAPIGGSNKRIGFEVGLHNCGLCLCGWQGRGNFLG